MIVYIDKITGFSIKAGETEEYPVSGDKFIVGNVEWTVDEVIQCKFSGNFFNKDLDYLAKCIEIKEYSEVPEKYIKPIKSIAENPDIWIKGLKMSPDGKAQSFEKDGRLWHRTLKADCNWNPWVEYV